MDVGSLALRLQRRSQPQFPGSYTKRGLRRKVYSLGFRLPVMGGVVGRSLPFGRLHVRAASHVPKLMRGETFRVFKTGRTDPKP